MSSTYHLPPMPANVQRCCVSDPGGCPLGNTAPQSDPFLVWSTGLFFSCYVFFKCGLLTHIENAQLTPCRRRSISNGGVIYEWSESTLGTERWWIMWGNEVKRSIHADIHIDRCRWNSLEPISQGFDAPANLFLDGRLVEAFTCCFSPESSYSKYRLRKSKIFSAMTMTQHCSLIRMQFNCTHDSYD